MLVVKAGNSSAGSLYTGKCQWCACEVLVQESEVCEERGGEEDGYTRRYCKCPTPLCGKEIDLTFEGVVTALRYAELVAKYGPEV